MYRLTWWINCGRPNGYFVEGDKESIKKVYMLLREDGIRKEDFKLEVLESMKLVSIFQEEILK